MGRSRARLSVSDARPHDVISGDTSPSETIVDQCNGCDALIHEVYTEAGYAKASPEWQRMRREYHTSSRQLGELATRARPGLLILYHQSYQFNESNEEDLMREMRALLIAAVSCRVTTWTSTE